MAGEVVAGVYRAASSGIGDGSGKRAPGGRGSQSHQTRAHLVLPGVATIERVALTPAGEIALQRAGETLIATAGGGRWRTRRRLVTAAEQRLRVDLAAQLGQRYRGISAVQQSPDGATLVVDTNGSAVVYRRR